MDYYGYAGNIADIDLSERKIQIEKLDWDLVERYRGLGNKYKVIL